MSGIYPIIIDPSSHTPLVVGGWWLVVGFFPYLDVLGNFLGAQAAADGVKGTAASAAAAAPTTTTAAATGPTGAVCLCVLQVTIPPSPFPTSP